MIRELMASRVPQEHQGRRLSVGAPSMSPSLVHPAPRDRRWVQTSTICNYIICNHLFNNHTNSLSVALWSNVVLIINPHWILEVNCKRGFTSPNSPLPLKTFLFLFSFLIFSVLQCKVKHSVLVWWCHSITLSTGSHL